MFVFDVPRLNMYLKFASLECKLIFKDFLSRNIDFLTYLRFHIIEQHRYKGFNVFFQILAVLFIYEKL